MREAHIVPLSRPAIAVLRDIQPLTCSGRLVFPSMRTNTRPISEGTLSAALRKLGLSKEDMTGHGFRTMASTLLNEQGWHPDLIELQLAHAGRNKVRAAYNRAAARRATEADANVVGLLGGAQGGRRDRADPPDRASRVNDGAIPASHRPAGAARS